MIVLWNALVLHARWGGMVKDRGLAVLAVGRQHRHRAGRGSASTSCGVGLHSYGVTEGRSILARGVHDQPVGDRRLGVFRAVARRMIAPATGDRRRAETLVEGEAPAEPKQRGCGGSLALLIRFGFKTAGCVAQQLSALSRSPGGRLAGSKAAGVRRPVPAAGTACASATCVSSRWLRAIQIVGPAQLAEQLPRVVAPHVHVVALADLHDDGGDDGGHDGGDALGPQVRPVESAGRSRGSCRRSRRAARQQARLVRSSRRLLWPAARRRSWPPASSAHASAGLLCGRRLARRRAAVAHGGDQRVADVAGRAMLQGVGRRDADQVVLVARAARPGRRPAAGSGPWRRPSRWRASRCVRPGWAISSFEPADDGLRSMRDHAFAVARRASSSSTSNRER